MTKDILVLRLTIMWRYEERKIQVNELRVFENEEFGSVRMQEIEGKVWFCGNDVAKILGYKNNRKAIKDHCRSEGVTNRYTHTDSGVQNVAFIDEGNVYRLIARSRLPGTGRFESWVFDEVLPQIRKTGGYIGTIGGREGVQELIKVVSVLAKQVNEIQKQVAVMMSGSVHVQLDSEITEICLRSPSRKARGAETKCDKLPESELAMTIKALAKRIPMTKISEMLMSRGYMISKSAIGRYSQKIKCIRIEGECYECLFGDNSVIIVQGDKVKRVRT